MKSEGAAEATPAHRGARRASAFWRFLAPVLALVAIGGAVALWYQHGHHKKSPEPAKVVARPHRLHPRLAGPAELAFLEPLSPGKPFKGWTVRAISAVYRGSIRVALYRGHDRIQLRVVKAGRGPVPPARSGPYAVYYSVKHVDQANATDVQALAEALARVAAKNQKLEPPGLTTFRQDSRDEEWE